MKIKSLKLVNFRNYEHISIDFDDGNNIIYGLNAQGKTNLIEAIYFVSTLKSFRTSKNRELIKLCQDYSHVECVFTNKNKEFTSKIYFDKLNKYKISINDVSYKTRFCGPLKTVVFCPDDLHLVKSGPEARRIFLNQTLFQFRPKYEKLVHDYNKYLKQKNHILKKMEEKPSFSTLIDDYNEQIAQLSAEISFIRANFISLLSAETLNVYSEISNKKEALNIYYSTKLTNPSGDIDKNKKEFEILLKSYKQAEISAKKCLIGIHKDDITFEIDGKSAREYASQGQIRSIVLSLKLGVREMFFKDTKTHAVLILDDVLSELDDIRRDFVINKIKNGQVIITTPYLEKIKLKGKNICIENGKIT